MAEQIERVQTATRDLAETRQRLERWLNRQLAPRADAFVEDLQAPAANGLSGETLLFQATWTDGGSLQAHRFAARVAPDVANLPVFPSYDLTAQFRLLEVLGRIGAVPVPRVWWNEPDPDAIGAPFFVMDRIDGEVPPDVMPYTFGGSWVSEASVDDQRRLQESSVAVLAAVHGITEPRQRFAFIEGADAESPLRAHVQRQRDYYAWVAGGTRIPLIERGFAWLEEHWPAEETPPALCWGDARIGNIMYRDFEPVAVLDWEMAAIAPPELDVAWFIFLHRFFEDLATTFELPGMPAFLRREDVVRSYERLTGTTLHDLDFYLVYAAVRQGTVMARTHQRRAHFGEAELPADPDDLVMHREALERMIAGTYWDAVG